MILKLFHHYLSNNGNVLNSDQVKYIGFMGNREILNLNEYCKNCDQFCCKGMPRISKNEAQKIVKESGRDYFKEEKLGYYVPKTENGYCKYLAKGKCSIQEHKPVDCLIYPIDPVFENDGKISFLIETKCPAAKYLTDDFVAEAKKHGNEWIKEFTEEQFNDYWKKNKVKSSTLKEMKQ